MIETRRLILEVPSLTSSAEVFALYAHPEVWASDPSTRHTEIAQTSRMIDNWLRSWERDGLGMWVGRDRAEPDHPLVGIGGCFVRLGVAWNLGFRLLPQFWGRGLAQEFCEAAIDAARLGRPDLPITAYLLEGNTRSQRSTVAAGLSLAWRGPDAGNPDPAGIRLLYSDRPLSDSQIAILTSQ